MCVCVRVFRQNEKCHLLIEHETQKLKELDEEHSQELREWRERLRPRKKVTPPVCLLTHPLTNPGPRGPLSCMF